MIIFFSKPNYRGTFFSLIAHYNCRGGVLTTSTLHRYGSPSMTDIEIFTAAYQERLDEAQSAGDIPEKFSLEVILFYFILLVHMKFHLLKVILLSLVIFKHSQ